ncbi:MAG TPA: lamin tail domain-containing protein [Planctomycetota bacterium]|nr:lamin tail domain-containing protein [Planctomycetota bacterium]
MNCNRQSMKWALVAFAMNLVSGAAAVAQDSARSTHLENGYLENGYRESVERNPQNADFTSRDFRMALLPLAAGDSGSRILAIQGGEPGRMGWICLRSGGPEGALIPIERVALDGLGTARVALPGFQVAEAGTLQWFGPSALGAWWAGPQVTIQPSPRALVTTGSVRPMQAGGMVISEIMKDPSAVSDASGEWLELFNRLWMRQNIEGWVLSDDNGASTILSNGGAGIWVAGRGFRALARNADPAVNGGVQAAYAYSGFTLGNGADQVILSLPDGTVVDRVAYDDGVAWPDTAGVSMELRSGIESVRSNDSPAVWCSATAPYGLGDLGTPGSANSGC